MNHKIPPQTSGSPSGVKEQKYRKIRITGWLFLFFPMVNVLYGIYVYRMYLPCDVNKMSDEQKEFCCAIGKFALALLFVFFFSVLPKNAGCIPKLCEHNILFPTPTQPSSEL